MVGSIFVTGGCGVTSKFTYPPDANQLRRVNNSAGRNLTVAVEPFTDFRGNDNSSMFMMYVIPLMPFGWGEYDRPDGARMFVSIAEFEMDVSEDLAKATATSLKASRLFKDAYFSYGGATSTSADIIVRSELKTLEYNGKIFSYGLSAFGPLLWFFGLPAGNATHTLEFDMEFTDAKTGKVLMRHSVKKEWSIVQGLYYNMGYDCRGFAVSMQEAMNELVGKLNSSAGKAVMNVRG